jgi:hypothetical protein
MNAPAAHKHLVGPLLALALALMCFLAAVGYLGLELSGTNRRVTKLEVFNQVHDPCAAHPRSKACRSAVDAFIQALNAEQRRRLVHVLHPYFPPTLRVVSRAPIAAGTPAVRPGRTSPPPRTPPATRPPAHHPSPVPTTPVPQPPPLPQPPAPITNAIQGVQQTVTSACSTLGVAC